jgi:ribosome-binding factor A
MVRKSPASKAPSQRQLRVGEVIRHTLTEVLQRGEVHDEVLDAHIVTIAEVRMSPDLKLATAYVMPLGGQDEKAVVEALNRNRKFLRGVVARRIDMKFAPDVRFRVDDSFDEAARIERLLRSPRVQQDLRAPDDHKDDEE